MPPPPAGASPLSIVPFLAKINQFILNPIILLMFAVALVVFLWGVLGYIRNADNPKLRGEGQQSMLWGIVGMFVMFGVYGIIKIVLNTIGVNVTSTFPF